MKIRSIEYKNHSTGLTIKKIQFHHLTLLVGASGVGKTQILKAILDIKNIATGQSVNGAEWKINFTIGEKEYNWKGKFSVSNSLTDHLEYFYDMSLDADISEEDLPNVLYEELSLNKVPIFSRHNDNIIFKKEKTVKLSKKKSLIDLLKEEDEIKELEDAFRSIKYKDNTTNEGLSIIFNDYSDPEMFDTLEKIKSSNRAILTKLYYAFHNKLNVFDEIQERFIEIFPNVESMEFVQFESKRFFRGTKTPMLSVNEAGIDKKIVITRLSSGMRRTLTQIAEIYLSKEGSVFLIDEFENSLGVNCIDELTDYILSPENDAQFIVTSHHPYIINNVETIHWKIVARVKDEIKTFRPIDLDIGKSKHESFVQLLNTDTFQKGTFAK